MLNWLLDNAIAIIMYIVLSIIAWVKLSEVSALKKEMAEHKNSAVPHPSCPVHDTMLVNIEKDIGQIKKMFETLEDRIYAIVSSNGRRKKDDKD